MEIFWSKENHARFPRLDRINIRTLLCIQKRTRFTLKDVLISHIIPNLISPLEIPDFYVANLPLGLTEDELKKEFPVKVDKVTVALRRNGRSKGFGFVRCFYYDDFENLKNAKGNPPYIQNHAVVIALSSYTTRK